MGLQHKKSKRTHKQRDEAIADVVKEDTTRLNVDLPVSLHRKIKIKAIEEGGGETISSITIRALNEYLLNHSSE